MKVHHRYTQPVSEDDLLERAARIAGKTLQHLAKLHGLSVPSDPARAKGWTGRMIEISLGATASSRPEPDFQAIEVELKTIPLIGDGKARESTFVCTVPLTPDPGITWETSLVKRKLSRVLWIPVEAEPSIALPERRIGTAILWSPDRQQERILREDWKELMNMIMMGELEHITASLGQALQIRPKAVNARSLRRGINREGEKSLTLPRGFYLRAAFTTNIIRQASIAGS